MPDALVETKLLRRAHARRRSPAPGSTSCWGGGRTRRLTLVSAPAGFGKTTVLGTWLRAGGAGRSTAWVTLDEHDRDSSSFWTVRPASRSTGAAPEAATAALDQLQSGQAPIEVVLTSAAQRAQRASAGPRPVVLDDYHLAEGPDVQPGMVFLVDHLPPQVHVVISTRADPALPLARLRARGELVEVRAADLRFTGAEATAYLNDLNTLGLEPRDVATLESRTEGWVSCPAARGAVAPGS